MSSESKVRSTRLPNTIDTRFESYRDEHDLSNSDALRELVRTGLDENEEGDGDREFSEKITRFDLLLAVASLAVAEFADGPASLALAALVVLYWSGLYAAHRYDVGRSA